VSSDLLVLAPDLPEAQLLVEVKVGEFDRREVEEQLRVNMVSWSCPVALLVTPTRTWLFRDSYAESGDEAIEISGEYPTTDLLGLVEVSGDEHELLEAVRAWLESLASTGAVGASQAPARQDIVRYLLPAVVEGRVVQEARR
jgi:hypothetical protein